MSEDKRIIGANGKPLPKCVTWIPKKRVLPTKPVNEQDVIRQYHIKVKGNRTTPVKQKRAKHRNKWSDEDLQMLIDMWNAGKQYWEIGKKMDRSNKAIQSKISVLRQEGLVGLKKAHWTEQRKRKLKELVNAGYDGVDIARMFGISKSAVYRARWRFGI